jgi:nucleotide-binding universal stress UspA family protein
MHVFISHGDADRPWVSELAESLRAEGIDVWLDASEVEPGKNWLREAARALERADAMILVFSGATTGSPELQKAFEFALSTQRLENRVITVERRSSHDVPADIPWVLRDLPFVRGGDNPRTAARQVLKFLREAA